MALETPNHSKVPSKVQAVVVGCGAAGLTALKNLLEEGFEAIALDERPTFGGLWNFSLDTTKTSVLKSTTANLSKQVSCFTDFSYGEEVPAHPSASDVAEYLKGYAERFGLGEYVRCGVEVRRVIRNKEDTRWEVVWRYAEGEGEGEGEGEEMVIEADKVVFAHGQYTVPLVPKLRDIDKFKGSVSHSRAFKSPAEYKSKRVLIIGFSNTGGDMSTELVNIAEKVYLSHNHGGLILKRLNKKGRPYDHLRTRRGASIVTSLENLIPNSLDALAGNRFSMAIVQRFNNGPLDPSWNLAPKSPFTRGSGAVVNDYLLTNLHEGKVISVPAVSKVLDDNCVELIDGEVLEDIDAIIFATGYKPVYSTLLPENDPSEQVPEISEAWKQVAGEGAKPLLRLYWNIFDLKYPTSLAFVGHVSAGAAAFPMFDVESMAIAQVFAGKFELPAYEELARRTERQNRWTIMKRRSAPVIHGLVPLKGLLEFLDEASGAGLKEHLGWGSWKAWVWWARNWRLARVVMGGVDTPFVWRLFEGTRKKRWDGAESAIWAAN